MYGCYVWLCIYVILYAVFIWKRRMAAPCGLKTAEKLWENFIVSILPLLFCRAMAPCFTNKPWLLYPYCEKSFFTSVFFKIKNVRFQGVQRITDFFIFLKNMVLNTKDGSYRVSIYLFLYELLTVRFIYDIYIIKMEFYSNQCYKGPKNMVIIDNISYYSGDPQLSNLLFIPCERYHLLIL